MLRPSLLLVLSCCAFLALEVAAAPPAGLEDLPIEGLPDPLPPPDMVEYDEELEPEITIVQRKDKTIAEYRVNGLLYMVKVTPFVGKPYYFIDRNGDGIMDSRMSDLYNTFQVPQWVIFSW